MSADRLLRRRRRGAVPGALCSAVVALGLHAGAGAAEGAGQTAPHAGPDRPAQAAAPPGATGPGAGSGLYPAPELFEASGTAVWDGGRTLRGVWVAHRLAPGARRARIVNTETGKSADGAVFKLDRDGAAASMMISSEAARLLGMAAGQEAVLRIVALTPTPPEQRLRPGLSDVAAIAFGAVAARGLLAAGESDRGASPDPVPEPVGQERPRPGAGDGTVLTAPAGGDPAAVPAAAGTATAAERQGSAPRVAPAPVGQAETAEVAAPGEVAGGEEPATVRDASLTTDDTAARPGGDPAAGAAARPAAAAERKVAPPWAAADPQPEADRAAEAAPPAAPGGADGTSRPEPSPGVAAADARVELAAVAAGSPLRADRPAEPVFAAVLPAASSPAAGPTRAGPPAQRYVQAGIFGVPGNAARLIQRLSAAEVPATGKPIRVGGRMMTRVVAGPFDTRNARDAALQVIRGMGLHDALAVAR